MNPETEHSRSYFLSAGESNAEGLMPLTLMVERLIEISTEHANSLGIGYAELIKKNIGWVLSRVSLEMYRYPRINETYVLTTWIESYNRFFSERNIAITAPGGEVLGYARTVWVAMDFEKRALANLTQLDRRCFPVADLPCPIDRTPTLAPAGEGSTAVPYTFKYCDLDFNRHVNTVRYIELLLNQKSLEHYDAFVAGRFDIHFHHECRYGQTVELRVESADGSDTFDIVTPDGKHAIVARIKWKEIIE